MPRQTFRTFLWEYLDSDCPLGDLARDVKRDKAWRGRTVEGLRTRMMRLGADRLALAALSEIAKHYARSQKGVRL